MKAKPVTMQELTDWVKANEHRTWHWPKITNGLKSTMEIKYLSFSLDTRDMEVWSISVEGAGPDYHACDKDEFDGTILELLESKLESV